MTASPPIAVLTNIANPYNQHLFDELRGLRRLSQVAFQGIPASEGRPWNIPLQSDELIVQGTWANWRHAREVAARCGPIVVSGNYTRPVDLARIVGTRSAAGPVAFWGERLSDGRHPWLSRLRRSVFRQFDLVLAVGTWAVPSYKRVLPPTTPVHVLPYTTSSDRPRGESNPDSPTVGFVGSLIPRKGLQHVLQGLSALPRPRRPLLEVAGSGPAQSQLRRAAAEYGLRVNWLGELDQAAIDEQRRHWWVQVVPSLYDGWGVVVAEALASGTPVLASNTTGAALDLVRDGVDGQVLEDHRQWPEVLLRYCDHDRVRVEGANARRIGQAVSAEHAAAFLAEVLEEPARPRDFVAEAWERARAAGLT